MKHLHKQGHDTDTDPGEKFENMNQLNVITCVMSCPCQTPETLLIRSVSATERAQRL